MASAFQVQAPESFSFSSPSEWPKWRRRFERFRIASGLDKRKEEEQVNTLIYLMGDQADDILLSFSLTADEKKEYNKVIEGFENHFIVRRNTIYERAKFNGRVQQEGETVDTFITSLYGLAEHCEYGNLHEEMIRDRIVVGVSERKLSERLQLDNQLTLQKAVTTVRQYEAVKRQSDDLQGTPEVNRVQLQKNRWKEKDENQYSQQSRKSENLPSPCDRCGLKRHFKGVCPAVNAECHSCKKKGHFERVCRTKNIVRELENDQNNCERPGSPNSAVGSVSMLGAVNNIKDPQSRWNANVQVDREIIEFKRDTRVSADASSYGLGAVLLQKDDEGGLRPIAYASRSLTPTEKRYVQIEREALACTWACERFKDFVTGLHFTLETDHQPLLQILDTKDLEDLSPRLQRLRMRLMRFSYDVEYTPGKFLLAADALSRAPLPDTGDEEAAEDIDAQVSYMLCNVPATDEKMSLILKGQMEDKVIQKLATYSQEGWPEKNKVDINCLPYWSVKSEITSLDGFVMKGCRLIIPPSMRDEIIDRLHAGHMGIVKCRARAKETVWWPGISKQIEEMVSKCPVCIQERHERHEPLIPTEFPDRPWKKVALDLFKLDGKWFVVLMDFYSRYPEVAELSKLTAAAVINHCKSFFARHGVPEEVRSDCGSQFKELQESEFHKFAQDYGFLHVTSSPRYPQSNGFAEAAVKTVKALLKKNKDPYKGLLEYRATPLGNGYTPAELLMGRRIRSTLPIIPQRLLPENVNRKTLKEREDRRINTQKKDYDKHHGVHNKKDFEPGEVVWVKDLKTWGTISKKSGSPRSYIVSTAKGKFRRNSFHLTRAHTRVDPEEIEVHWEDEAPPILDQPQRQQQVEPQRGDNRNGPYQTRSGRTVRPPIRYGHQD